jgi:hypothetical protein
VVRLEERGIKSPVVQAAPEGLYLLGGLVRHGGLAGQAVLGIECFPETLHPNAVNYRPRVYREEIIIVPPELAAGGWQQLAVVQPMADRPFCQLFLEQVGGVAEFDNIVWAAISLRR